MDQSTKMRLEGNWQQFKGQIKDEWGDLTDDELQQTEGKWDQLVGTIKEKTGETTDAIERKLADITS